MRLHHYRLSTFRVSVLSSSYSNGLEEGKASHPWWSRSSPCSWFELDLQASRTSRSGFSYQWLRIQTMFYIPVPIAVTCGEEICIGRRKMWHHMFSNLRAMEMILLSSLSFLHQSKSCLRFTQSLNSSW